MDAKIKVCIDAWDDPEFRRAFDRAYERVVSGGLSIDSRDAARRAELLLIAAGFPDARVVVERSVGDAFSGTTRWSVYRSAPAPVVAG